MIERRRFTHLAGDSIQRGISLISIPILAHLLGPIEYGHFAVAGSAISLVIILCISGLPTALVRDIASGEITAERAAATSLVFVFGPLLVVGLLFVICSRWLGLGTGMVAACLFASMGGMFFQISQACLLVRHRHVLHRIAACGTAIVTALVAIGATQMGMGSTGAVLAMAIGFFCATGFGLGLTGRMVRPDWHWLKGALRYGLPITLYAIGGWVVELSGRVSAVTFVAPGDLGRNDLGCYGLAAQYAACLSAVATALNTADMPSFMAGARWHTRWHLAIVAITGMTGACAAPWIFEQLSGGAYRNGMAYVPLLLMAAFTGSCWWFRLANPLFRSGRTTSLAIAAGAGVVATFAVLPLGLMVGPIACALAQLSGCLVMTVVAYRQLPVIDRPDRQERWLAILTILAIPVVSWFFSWFPVVGVMLAAIAPAVVGWIVWHGKEGTE